MQVIQLPTIKAVREEPQGPQFVGYWASLERAQGALDRGVVSARGLDRALRVAWSLADLEGAPMPSSEHVHEALSLRTGGVT